MKYIFLILFIAAQATAVSQVYIQRDSIKSLIGRNQKFYTYAPEKSDTNFTLNPFGSRTIWDFSQYKYDSIPSVVYYDSSVANSACKNDEHFLFSNFLEKTITQNDSSFDYYYLSQSNLVLLGNCPNAYQATRYKSGLIKLGQMPLQLGKTWDSDNKVDYTADSTFKFKILDTGKVDSQGEVIIKDTLPGKTRTLNALRIKTVTYISFDGSNKLVPSVKYAWYSNPSDGNFLIARATVDSSNYLVSMQYYDPLSKRKGDTGGPGAIHDNKYLTKLLQNSPNPFTTETGVSFTLKDYAKVKIELLDLSGKVVATPKNEAMFSGEHKIMFETSNLPASTYLCQFYINDKLAGSMKMIKQ